MVAQKGVVKGEVNKKVKARSLREVKRWKSKKTVKKGSQRDKTRWEIK